MTAPPVARSAMPVATEDAFPVRDGIMHCEGVPLPEIAAVTGTPFYCYAAGAIRAAWRRYEAGLAGLDPSIHYAVKANSNLAVIRLLAGCGAGADVVSIGEVRQALAAGVPAGKIVFSGAGKTRPEIAAALEAGLRQFNVESGCELDDLIGLARERGIRADIALRLNPDVDARTHAKIATGRRENKFGVPAADAPRLFRHAAAAGHPLNGLAVHIGSQLTDMAPFDAAYGVVAAMATTLGAAGHRIRRLDLGGGIGIPCRGEAPADLVAYGQLVRRHFGGLDCRLMFEPGRYLVGPAGLLVAATIRVKAGADRHFVVVDAAMNDFLRPALYDAWHDIRHVVPPADGPAVNADIVGPVCETGDTFATGRPMILPAAGGLLAFTAAGAYGAVMASNYNSRPLPAEVMVDGDRFAIVRPRQNPADLLARDTIPPWLNGSPRSTPPPRQDRRPRSDRQGSDRQDSTGAARTGAPAVC